MLVAGRAGGPGGPHCTPILAEGRHVPAGDGPRPGDPATVAAPRGYPLFAFRHRGLTGALGPGGDVAEPRNLACPALPRHDRAYPIGPLRRAVNGTLGLFRLARSCGARVPQASTFASYGDPLVPYQAGDQSGSVTPAGPRACPAADRHATTPACAGDARLRGLTCGSPACSPSAAPAGSWTAGA